MELDLEFIFRSISSYLVYQGTVAHVPTFLGCDEYSEHVSESLSITWRTALYSHKLSEKGVESVKTYLLHVVGEQLRTLQE